MADNDESLLDAFVTIAARGMSETERDIDDFVARVKKTFGSMEVGSKIATGVKANMRKAVDDVREQAEKIKKSLRDSLLLFGQDKDFLSIQVRLLGDNDIKRRLQDLQSQVSAETKEFNLADPGRSGDAERIAAINQINLLRETELKTLQEITYEQLRQRGLDSVYENQAEAFLKLNQNAQLFNQELKELNRLVSSTRDVPLIDEFSKLKTEIERAQLALRQGLASGSLVDADAATAQLNTLRLRFDQFRNDAEKSIFISTNAKQVADEFSRVSEVLTKDSQLLNQELRELNRLVSSTKDVPLIAEFSKLKTEIERAQLALKQGLSSESLVDSEGAMAQLNALRAQFGKFRDDANRSIIIRTDAEQAAEELRLSLKRVADEFNESLLRFGQDKDFLSIQVRLLGDNDIKRRLQDLQSQVSAETKAFNLAEPGVPGNAERIAAINQINLLRETELKTLQEITYEQLKQRGLDSVYENQAEALRKNAQNAQLLNQEVKELNRLISSTRDVPLIDEFSKLKTEIERAQLALRQGLASGNLVDVDDATAQLNTLRLQFDRFRDDAQKSIVIRTNAQDIKANFDSVLAAIRRNEARDSSLTRGSAITGGQRIAIADLKREVSEVTFEFRRLSSQTDLTARDIQELTVLFGRLQQAGQNIGDIRDEIQSAVQPTGVLSNRMNTLSNNAYQMGQAFEDAAVGFSLNGIAGAVRGASNNVTFLIQNLAQAKAAQAALSGQIVSPLIAALPLYASIAAAIGLITVGPLTEWISSLNDIEVKTQGLADLIERSFKEAKFLVSIELDGQSALKAIQDAKDATEAIGEIIKQAEELEINRFKILSELDLVSQTKVFEGIQKMVSEMQEASSELLFDVKFPDPHYSGKGEIVAGSPPDEEALRRVENLNAALELLQNSYRLAQEQAARGENPSIELENASNAIRRLTEGYDELHEAGLVPEEDAETHKENLEKLKGPIDEAAEASIRLQVAQEKILNDGLEALGVFKGLSAEYKFLDAVNDGRLEKEDKILFDMQQQNVAIDEQAKKLRDLFGNNNPQVEAAIENQRDNLQEEQRIDLTTEVLDIEKKITEERERAAKDAESAEKRRLDIQERILKEQRDAIKDSERDEKKRLKIEERISDAAENAAERAAKNEQALNDAKNARDLSQMEKALQKRIELLQKADVQSRNFQLGDVGTIAFKSDTKNEVERLQKQLKDLRESANEASAENRIQELQKKIISDREDSQEKVRDLREDLQNAMKEKNDAFIENQKQMEDLRADLAKARQDEIKALNKNADEINELNEQLQLLNGAIQQNQNGGIIGIPELDANGNRNGPMFLPEGDAKAVGEAQAQANAAAMQNVDFKSSSMETLIAQSNRLLSSISTTIQNQDLQPRLV